jgi:hypothetical protein
VPNPIFDQVSIDRAGTSLCGAISYDISEVAGPGVTGLTITELTISSSGQISIWTDAPSTVGAHTVTIIAKLSSYPSVTIQKVFTLTVTGNCLISSISIGPTVVENFVTFAGYSIKSQLKYNYNDT